MKENKVPVPAVDPESSRLLIHAANMQHDVTLTIHEYYLTLSPTPTLCALSIQLKDGQEHAVSKSFSSPEEVHDCVGEILSDYPLTPSVYCVQHFKRA